MWFFSEATGPELTSADKALDFSAAVPSPLTVTRSGTAGLSRDNSGRWVSAPANTARSWYDPITLEIPYTLVEPERSQLLYRTRQPTLTAVQATTSYNSTIQTPFGPGSILFVPNTTSTTHGWNLFFGTASHGAALADNTTVALSAVLRPSGTYTNITFFLLNRTNIYSSVQVALEGNGSVVSSTGVISAEVRRDTDGFYTVEIVNNYGTGTTTPSFNAGFHDQTGTRTFAGNGTSGFYLAYIGAEIGSEVTSPIINAGTSVITRPADVLSGTSEWIESGSKTFGMVYVPMSRGTATVLNISGIDQLTLTNTPSSVSMTASVGLDQVASITAPAPPRRVERTVVMTMTAGSVLMTQDGAVIGSDNSGTKVPGAFSSMRIGDTVAGGSGGPMLVRLIKYWSEALPQDSSISYSDDLTQEFDTQQKISVSVQPTLTITPAASSLSLLVLLSGEPIGTSVFYSTADETALSGVDYVGASGTLPIPPGATSGTISIGLLPRGEITDKTFKIVLNSATGASISKGICVVLLMRKLPQNAPASTKMEFGASLPADVSLVRPSPAWTRNSTGVWTQVAANAYRQHFVASGVSGLLIEPAAAEQYLFDSVDPSFVVAGGTRTIVTSEVTPAGSRQIQFRENTDAGSHKLSLTLGAGTGITPSSAFAVSFIIRPVSRGHFVLFIKGTDNIPRTIVLDLTGTGTATSVYPELSILVERDPFRPSWYRVSVSQPQAANAGVPAIIDILCALQGGNSSFSGTSGSGFDLCHIQVEPGAGSSSPIIVTGAADKTVRAADILKASGTWHQRQTYSLGVRFRRLRDSPATQRLWMAKDVANQAMGVEIKNGVMSYDVAGQVPLVTFEVQANGTQTAWPLPNSGTDGPAYTVIVTVDGAFQATGAYTLANNTVTFDTPPPSNATVEIRGLPFANVVLESTGTGDKAVWILPGAVTTGAASLLISVDGIIQNPNTYSIAADQLTFTQIPPFGSIISVRRIGASVQFQAITASGTPTTLTMAQAAAAGPSSLLVSVDGLLQTVSSYATAGTTLTLSQAPPANAQVDIRFLSR